MLLVRSDAPVDHDDTPTLLFNRRAGALGLTITFMALQWLCSLLRLYARFIFLGSPWWDDLFMVLALISTTVGAVVFCLLQNFGMGKHIYDLQVSELSVFMKGFYIGSVSYTLSLTLIKLAILLQYLRIFDEIRSRRRRRFCRWLIGFTSVWGLFYCIPAWVPCYPVSSMWNFSQQGSRNCWGFSSPDLAQSLGFYISHSVTTTVMDLLIYLLPLPLVFRPKTQRKTRISLLCLFGLGLAASLCSIARLVFSLKPTLDAMQDLTWNSPTTTGLAIIEICLASVCAALPVFWPVLENSWGMIFVTYEVKITREYGIFIPRTAKKPKPPEITASSNSFELTTISAQPSQSSGPPEWNPYVGDAKTGLGDSETIIESLAERPAGWFKKAAGNNGDN